MGLRFRIFHVPDLLCNYLLLSLGVCGNTDNGLIATLSLVSRRGVKLQTRCMYVALHLERKLSGPSPSE